MSKILIVVSSHTEWRAAGRETGYWIGEVSHFVEVVEEAGYEVDIVSPLGGAAPMDPKSVKGPQASDGGYRAYERNPELRKKLENTLRPDEVVVDDYVAIYFAGGHGTMWDFPDNERLAEITAELYEKGHVVSAVCHGVTGLLNVRLADGSYLIAGKAVTGFSNLEERLMRLTDKVPYLTETRMRERGADYRRGAPVLSHVVATGRLVTGQNPRSTTAVARKLVEVLREQRP